MPLDKDLFNLVGHKQNIKTMKFQLLIKSYLIVFLIITQSSFIFGQMRGPLEEPFIPGHIIIQVNDGVDVKSLVDQLPSQYEFKINRQLSKIMRAWLIEFNSDELEQMEAIRLIYDYPEISIAQNNHLVEVRSTIPNDPEYGSQWHHKNTGQGGGTPGADIKSEEAWEITTGGKNANGDDIVVCILEQVDFSHNDLQANHWTNTAEIPGNGIDDDGNGYIDDIHGWNVGNNSGNLPTNNSGHGTNVAGMIGAVGDNNLGVVGANWDVKMMNITGYNTNSEASVISAYEYPLVQRQIYNQTNGAQGAFVVATNASWGIDNANPNNYPLWCAYYDTLGKYGILNCGATSNSNINVDVSGDMPTGCSSQYMVGIGRSDRNDNFQGGYGATTINFAAPGINVRTTANNNSYTTTTGTSFASPLTAGVIALMYSIPCPNFMSTVFSDPQHAADLVFHALMDGTDERPALVGNFVTGGRLNAKNAIDLLMEEVCSPCNAPSDISVEDLAEHTVSLVYSENEDVEEYKFYYREVGFSQWNEIYTSSTSIDLNQLNKCTTYEYYMEAICADEISQASAISTFTTLGCDDCLETNYCEVTVTNPELQVAIWSPSSIAGDLTYTETTGWGGAISDGYVYGDLVLVDDGSADPTEGCNELINASELEGKIAVALRGTCNFTAKALNAQEAGAIGIIIANNGGQMIQMGGTEPSVTIPAIKISTDEGADIISALQNDENITAMIGNQNEFIQSFTWGGAVENSGDNNGYFSSSLLLEASLNDEVSFTIEPGFDGPALPYGIQIWIDLDQDGSFDANEKLYETTEPITLEELSDVITIPSSTEIGTTKMRLVMAYQGVGSEDLPDACVDFTSGEVEDYCIEILDDQICNTKLEVLTTEPSCSNVFNGAIEIEVDGTVDDYTFEWNNGLTGNEIASLSAGNYAVTITNLDNCDTTVNVSLVANDGITIHLVEKLNESCDDLADGSIEIEASGSDTYSFSWNNGGSAAINENLTAGTHIVTVTGSEGCIAQETYTIIATDNIEINSIVQQPTCVDSEDGSIEIEALNGGGTINYQWTNGPSSNIWENLGNGTYEITVSNDDGCSATREITLESEGVEPTASFSETGTGGVTKNFINESEDADSYLWDFGDGTTTSTTNASHTYEEAGEFEVCLTALNACGEDTECMTVTVREEDLSADNLFWTEGIRVYPNPTKDIVNFEIPHMNYGTITLVDATGKIVLTQTIKDEKTTINVEHLVTGLYVYSITNLDTNAVYKQKLSIQ